MGGPGSGKTVFALQTLVNGAREWGEPGILVAFEENSRHIISNAATFGWDLPALEKDRLFFLDARMPPDVSKAGEFDLAGMLASLKAKADQMQARRIVFDSIDVLLTLISDPAVERRELYRLHDWMGQSGFTGIITARVGEGDPLLAQRMTFLQFMADCVVHLYHRVEERVSLRALRVVKYRGSGFAENEFPLVIGASGVDVAGLGLAAPDYAVFTERASTGVERLDTMLGGGYYRGSSVLITGAPGTAKSTLCGAFAQAACRRGERCLYVSFDENANEIVRNLASVNIHLAPHIKSGLLRIESFRTEVRSAEEHLILLRAMIRDYAPRCLVIDPLSAMVKAGGQINALSVSRRLLYQTKGQGITLVCTSLLDSDDPMSEATPLQISTVADSWIHVSYVIQAGERNRALTIIKSRGSGHSNQVRELVLSNAGLTLADVYTAEGAVLMGALRVQKEQAEQHARERAREEAAFKRRQLELTEADVAARIEALRRELEARRAELAWMQSEQDAHGAERWEQQAELRHLRGADTDTHVDSQGGAG